MPKFRKYTEEIREKIKKDYLSGMSLKEISARYSIDSRRIAEIAKTITTIPDIEEKPKMKVQYNNEIKSEDSVKTINNTSTVEYTVEQLLNKNGYSPNEWEVTSVNSNTWDDSAGVTHHQTKINIVKKVVNIELQLPSKIQVNLSANPPRKLRGNGNLKCALILPDMQCGFRRNINNGSLVSIHDREAMDVALQIAHYLDPDRIVLLGDNLDLAEMSLKYSVPSDMYFTTQASLVELSWWLSKFRCINESTKIDYLEGNHECFSEDTQILTKDGWKYYYEVDDNTEIGTFNKKTKEIEFQKFIEAQIYNYEGEMYEIKALSTDLLVTPNHRLYWANNNSPNNFEMICASDVKLNNSRKIQYSSGINLKQDVDICDNMIKLIAWIITDGSTRKTGNYKNIIIYQRKEKVNLITTLLDSLEIKYRLIERNRNISEICGVLLKNQISTQCEIHINSDESKKIYEHINEKYVLPEWTYEMSERQVDLFIQSLVDGDGSRVKNHPNSLMLYGIKEVLDQVQHLLTINGYRSSISEYRKNQYRLNFTKNTVSYIDRIKNHIRKVNYKGIVWDFTVPNDTLVVRRNDKVSITGNCRLNKLTNERAMSVAGLKSVNNLKGNSALSVQNLLSLDDLDIEYHSYPNGKVALNSNLVCIHGEVAKGQSGATVSELVKSARVSVIQGHIHRHEVATKTTWDAYDNFHMYTAASFGCLCKLDPGIVPGMKHLQNWQQGVGVVWYEEDGLEQFRTEFIPIINGRAIYTSEIFEAESEDKIAMTIEKEMKFKVT